MVLTSHEAWEIMWVQRYPWVGTEGASNKKAAVFLSFGDRLPLDLSLCAPALLLALGWVLETQINKMYISEIWKAF